MKDEKAVSTSDLQKIPGVGPSIAQDLVDLGFRRVSDLRRKNPEAMYEAVCAMRGEQQDRCLLYVFRSAVYFATPGKKDPELLKWWNWKDRAPASRAPRRAKSEKARAAGICYAGDARRKNG